MKFRAHGRIGNLSQKRDVRDSPEVKYALIIHPAGEDHLPFRMALGDGGDRIYIKPALESADIADGLGPPWILS